MFWRRKMMALPQVSRVTSVNARIEHIHGRECAAQLDHLRGYLEPVGQLNLWFVASTNRNGV